MDGTGVRGKDRQKLRNLSSIIWTSQIYCNQSHDQYPNETPHIVEVRSLWTGAALRAAPRAYAKSCGQLDFGQYVCGVEREGFWLRLTMEDGTDGPDAHWVCVQDRDGKTLLEPVRDADMGNPSVPQEDALADKFDRPFEPRLQAPDFEKPEATGTGRNCTNLTTFVLFVCPFLCGHLLLQWQN